MQQATYHDQVMKVAHRLRLKKLPLALATTYDEAVRRKWSRQAARADEDFDLNKAVGEVDEDLRAARVRVLHLVSWCTARVIAGVQFAPLACVAAWGRPRPSR